MSIMFFVSNAMIPFVIAAVLLLGISNKIPVFDVFTEGAKDGFSTVLGILPTLIGLMVAVGVLRASGALDYLSAALSHVTDLVGFPKEVLPLTFMRLVSSSAATGLLLDIYKNFGPDSFIGRFASVMMSCTETIFYTLSVYFLSVNIKRTRYTLAGALFANVVGIIASIYITVIVFGK